MKKKNTSRKRWKAIRRNTAYGQSRTLSLIYCVLLVGVIGLLVFVATHEQPFSNRMAWLFGGILAGVAGSACLYHFLFAHYDQADALAGYQVSTAFDQGAEMTPSRWWKKSGRK